MTSGHRLDYTKRYLSVTSRPTCVYVLAILSSVIWKLGYFFCNFVYAPSWLIKKNVTAITFDWIIENWFITFIFSKKKDL